MITILIPAHNEEAGIEKTIQSIQKQTINKEDNINIVAICDNCTDRTVEIVKSFKEVELFETKNNSNKKAGALNQFLFSKRLEGFVLVMDADTVLDENLIAAGVKELKNNEKLGAVCSRAGILTYENLSLWQKLLWHLQHIEYAEFDSHRVETENKIKVAHGMATMFRADALYETINYRRDELGIDIDDEIYREDNLVEDYELTLCLKAKWKLKSCLDMYAWTDVPLNLKELHIQRLRWLRGGVDTLREHGLNKITLPEILTTNLFWVAIFLRAAVLSTTIGYIFCGKYYLNLFMLIIVGFAYMDSFYRMKYVQGKKTFDYIVKLLIIPELLYSYFQAYTLIKSFAFSYLNIEQKW